MTDDHFIENPGERNRRLERESDKAFDSILEPAQGLIKARAALQAEIRDSGGLSHISTGCAVLIAQIELVRAINSFKPPECPRDEY